MKLALATHTSDVSTAPGVALLSGSFPARLSKARRIGYDGVELMVARPRELLPPRLRAEIDAAGLQICAVASGPVFMLDRLSLLAETAQRAREAEVRLHELISLAAAIGAPLVTVGSFRGRLAWAGGASARASLKSVLSRAADHGAGCGVRLVLEPLNRYESDVVNTCAEALAFIAETGHDHLGVLLDTFHVNIEEASILACFREALAAGKLWHVHLGDSNRRPPGQGHIDFESIVRTLQSAGYDGWLSAELLPFPDPDGAAEATLTHMRRITQTAEGRS